MNPSNPAPSVELMTTDDGLTHVRRVKCAFAVCAPHYYGLTSGYETWPTRAPRVVTCIVCAANEPVT